MKLILAAILTALLLSATPAHAGKICYAPARAVVKCSTVCIRVNGAQRCTRVCYTECRR